MARRTDFTPAITYKGQKLKGLVEVGLKIDGVRILYRDGKFVTRNNKVPPGLDLALTDAAKRRIREYGDCEIYRNNFFDTNGPLQQHSPALSIIKEKHIFVLDVGLQHQYDPRLRLGVFDTPDPDLIWEMMNRAVTDGYEGLVLRCKGKWYRAKPDYTADVYITGWFEQLDKNKNPKGQLGGFTTKYGKVTAFSEELRVKLWDNPEQYVGRLMEVQYKELYHTGKFRYCVTFRRFRDDKSEETFDTKNI